MRERPVSVTLFGILNIGFGLLGLGWALLSKLLEGFDSAHSGASLSPYFSTMMAIWDQISFPMDIAAGLALTAAGIGLLLLKNWSRLLSNGWAVYTIISVFVNLAVLFVALHRVLAGALHSSTTGAVALVLASAAINAILTLVYPLLLLYFMSRPKVVPAFQREPVSPPNHE